MYDYVGPDSRMKFGGTPDLWILKIVSVYLPKMCGCVYLFIYLFILIAWFEMSVLSDEVAFYCFAVTVQKHLAVICDSEVWR